MGVFTDILTYYNLRKATAFFNPSIFNQISLIVIFADNNGVAGGKQREKLPLIIIVNNWINKRASESYRQFSAFVSNGSIT